MKKGKVKDLVVATKEETISTILTSDSFSEFAGALAESVVSEGVAGIVGELAGAVIPGINSIRLSYKQKRFEYRVKKALEFIYGKLDTLEANFSSLEQNLKDEFKTKYLDWMLDNLYEEKQDEKIPYHVNGYINLMNNSANDNLMLMFFETINELTELDIDVLKMYDINSADNIFTLCEKHRLSPDQTLVIKEKLSRLGLLQSKNEEYREENLDYIADYLLRVAQESKKSKPKDIEFKKNKITKIKRSESFHITSLGRNFLSIIS
jgi:hypothetical protein